MTAERGARWRVRPWLAVLSGMVAVLFGLFVYWTGPVNTTGNTAIWFTNDVRSGVFEDAYERLCRAERDRMSLEEFMAEDGGDYAVFRDPVRGIRGADEQYPNAQTLDRAIDRAWSEVDVFRDGTVETWRLLMVREGEWLLSAGLWKVCGIDLREERADS